MTTPPEVQPFDPANIQPGDDVMIQNAPDTGLRDIVDRVEVSATPAGTIATIQFRNFDGQYIVGPGQRYRVVTHIPAPQPLTAPPGTVGMATVQFDGADYPGIRGVWVDYARAGLVFVTFEPLPSGTSVVHPSLILAFTPKYPEAAQQLADVDAQERINTLTVGADHQAMEIARLRSAAAREKIRADTAEGLLARLTPDAVRVAVQVGAWIPDHQKDSMVRRVLGIVDPNVTARDLQDMHPIVDVQAAGRPIRDEPQG